jgi:hypothetical protein
MLYGTSSHAQFNKNPLISFEMKDGHTDTTNHYEFI